MAFAPIVQRLYTEVKEQKVIIQPTEVKVVHPVEQKTEQKTEQKAPVKRKYSALNIRAAEPAEPAADPLTQQKKIYRNFFDKGLRMTDKDYQLDRWYNNITKEILLIMDNTVKLFVTSDAEPFTADGIILNNMPAAEVLIKQLRAVSAHQKEVISLLNIKLKKHGLELSCSSNGAGCIHTWHLDRTEV